MKNTLIIFALTLAIASAISWTIWPVVTTFAAGQATQIHGGAMLPTHCDPATANTPADLFAKTDGALYLCTATDTWTKVGSTTYTGSAPIVVSGTVISCPTGCNTYTGSAPIAVSGTVISCANCASSVSSTAKGTILSMAGGNTAGGTIAGNAGPWWKGTNTGQINCAGAFWLFGGYVRNLTLSLSTDNTSAGGAKAGQLSLDCPAGNMTTYMPGGPVAGPGTLKTTGTTDGVTVYRVNPLGQMAVQTTTRGSGSTGTQGKMNAMTGEFIGDAGMLSVMGAETENPFVGGVTPGFVAPYYNSGYTTEANVTLPIPIAGNLTGFLVSCTNANGANTTTSTVRLNGADSAITFTIPSAGLAGPYYDNTHTVAVVAGDRISWKWVSGGAVTACTPGYQMLGFLPTNGTSSIIGVSWGGNSITTTATYIQPLSTSRSSTETDVHIAVPRAGVAGNLYVFLPSTTGGIMTVTLVKNGVDQALTCAIPSGTTTQVYTCDTTHTVTYAQGDMMSLKAVMTSGSATGSGMAWTYD